VRRKREKKKKLFVSLTVILLRRYLLHGILFKFAIDNQGLYNGDANAMKAAKHELRGCMSYYNCAIPKLCVPLMAVIDYRCDIYFLLNISDL